MRQVAEKISLIGSEGSGKTCFLAGLRWLSSPTEATPCISAQPRRRISPPMRAN